MKKIGYLIPYFGKLPRNFQLWLNSCAANPTIDWIILTNDQGEYEYPENVKVTYSTFDSIKNRIQQHFSFEVMIETPWNLSLFKPAYGEIFAEELVGYDFWGHCDVDVLWGNIRAYITDEVLECYDKIGFQGHSLLYRNTPEVNARYKTIVPDTPSYIDVFSGKTRWSFDENGMDRIYKALGLLYFKEPVFAHLAKYEYSFYLRHQPEEDTYKNYRQVFLWENGVLTRYYLVGGKIRTEEFMYIHFFCRPMKYLEKNHSASARYIIYPDVVKDFDGEITVKLLKKLGKKGAFAYYCSVIWANRKKLTPKKILFNVKRMLANKKKRRT